jgi:cephalosporin-C deacetylase
VGLFDLSLDELYEYQPKPELPADFEAFWKGTLAETGQHPLEARFTPHDAAMSAVEVFDVRFAGWGGHPISAWLVLPRGGDGPLPCVVQYLGYRNGRGNPHDHTLWAAAGMGLLVMDTRGEAGSFSSPGSTADPHADSKPHTAGLVTRGIHDPEEYFYRRVFTDAVRAIDAAAAHPRVDGSRIVVAGGSQGGAIAQATAALSTLRAGTQVAAALIDVPFLTHVRRAVDITDGEPYQEIVRYLAAQRARVEETFATLAYFDGLAMASLGTAPALYSAALRDEVCPPSTVFAAYNAWRGPKEITVWPFNKHEGGATEQRGTQLRYLRELLGNG